MTEEQALIAACVSNRFDMTPRRIYADYLEENGRAEQADLLRTAIDLDELPYVPTCLAGKLYLYMLLSGDAVWMRNPWFSYGSQVDLLTDDGDMHTGLAIENYLTPCNYHDATNRLALKAKLYKGRRKVAKTYKGVKRYSKTVFRPLDCMGPLKLVQKRRLCR